MTTTGSYRDLPALASDGVVHNGTRGRVSQTLGAPSKKYPGGDAFLDNYDGHLGLVVVGIRAETRGHLGHFVLPHHMHLPIPNTVSKNHHSIRQTAVHLITHVHTPHKPGFTQTHSHKHRQGKGDTPKLLKFFPGGVGGTGLT